MTSWKPSPRQEEFLSIPFSVFEALYGGAAGGGKSEVLLYLPLVYEFYKDPKFKGLLLRRTLPELERELILRSQADKIFTGCGATYRDQKKRWEFPSGAVLQFGHLEHETDVKIYDTAEYNYIGWDEATSFTPYQYEYLSFSRCRSSSSNLPAIVRAGTNPGGVSHNYFRRRFVEPCRSGGKIIKETRSVGGKEIAGLLFFVKSLAIDNPFLIKNDPDYVNRIQRLPEAERIAKAEGDWWIFSGQVFDEFRERRLLSEPPQACHVIPQFPIPYYWSRLLSIDWGYAAMTHALWWAINPLPCERYPAKIYVYREYAGRKEKISTWAANLSTLSGGEQLADVVLDPSAFGNRGDERTIAQQFEESFGRAARRADNDRIGGKLLIQEYLRWRQHPPRYQPPEGYDSATALRIRRIQGEEALKDYEKLFIVQPDELLPKLQIFDNCKELINAIPLCVYDKNHTEDVEEFEGDDPYDNFRYGLKACQNYLETGRAAHEFETERARVIQNYERTGNTTGFYMNMERLERSEARSAAPIYRRRRGNLGRRFNRIA